ncbi:MAG: hypothetical protein SGARI_000155 [Bacillariaceae sp.]
MKLLIQEYEEGGGDDHHALPVCEYIMNNPGSKPSIVARKTTKTSFLSPLQILKDLFLPIGYPHSVDASYLPYQLWDGLQGLCSYWRGVISTKAVMQATGVGNAQATALSAALQWALRDGIGMVGGLCYSYLCSPKFDSHPLEFRLLLADVINDVALTLDMMAPFYPERSMYILALSTMGKVVCGITAGATKGRITQHFAHHGNMADLSAKESTQETLVSLLGMIGGVWVAKLLEHHDDQFWTWVLFGALTILHVWANYKAVSVIKLATFNPERTRVLFDDAVTAMARHVRLSSSPEKSEIARVIDNLPSPDEIQESMFASVRTLLFPTVHTTLPLDKAMKNLEGHGGGKIMYIWLKKDATNFIEIQAYVHALLLQELLCSLGSEKPQEYSEQLVTRSYTVVQSFFSPKLVSLLKEKGWDVDSRCYFGFPSTRLKVVAEEAGAKKDK